MKPSVLLYMRKLFESSVAVGTFIRLLASMNSEKKIEFHLQCNYIIYIFFYVQMSLFRLPAR